MKIPVKFDLVIVGETVLEIYDFLTLLRTTTPTDGPCDNRAKRRRAAFCLKSSNAEIALGENKVYKMTKATIAVHDKNIICLLTAHELKTKIC